MLASIMLPRHCQINTECAFGIFSLLFASVYKALYKREIDNVKSFTHSYPQKHLKSPDLYSIIYAKIRSSTNRSGFLKNNKFVTHVLILFGIVWYTVFLGFTPLLHDHEHDHEHAEHSHSEESCVACVFINTHVEFEIQPTAIVFPSPCCGKFSPSEVVFVPLIPTTSVQSRAPPTFSNSI